MHAFLRTEMLIGADALKKLGCSWVAVFGIGGVGSYAVEGLVRSGIGRFTLVDNDCVCVSNLNRQIHATSKTIGRSKVEVMKERILDINPEAIVEIHEIFLDRNSSETLISENYNYIIDAIDTVTSKIELVVSARQRNIPIVSSMGTGNKINPSLLEVDDLYNTSVCPLAKVMRKELRKRDVESLKVVYSKEEPLRPLAIDCSHKGHKSDGVQEAVTLRRSTPGSMSFVPSSAGLLIASEVVKDLLDIN